MVIEFWYWWVLAFVLLIFEMLTPGYFFMWLAISGVLTGALVGLVPLLSFNMQVLVFSIFALLAIVVSRLFGKQLTTTSDQPFLNKRGSQYIGRIFPLYSPIENGQGQIKVDDTVWKVHGKDCGINRRVKITGIKGIIFEVDCID